MPTDRERPMTEDEKREYNKIYWGLQDFWKKQEGKTFSELKNLIIERGGNFIQLRQFRFNELVRLNKLIEECHKRQLTEEEIKEAQSLEQLRRDSFGIRGTLIVPINV